MDAGQIIELFAKELISVNKNLLILLYRKNFVTQEYFCSNWSNNKVKILMPYILMQRPFIQLMPDIVSLVVLLALDIFNFLRTIVFR